MAVGYAKSGMMTDGYLSGPRHGGSADDADEARRCPRCGASNDPEYRYCADCVTRIA